MHCSRMRKVSWIGGAIGGKGCFARGGVFSEVWGVGGGEFIV